MLSALVALTLLLATFITHFGIERTQVQQLRTLTSTFANAFAAKLEAHIEVRLGVVDLMRKDWEVGRIVTAEEFREKSLSVHALFDDLQALNWVSPKGIIEIVTPTEGNEAALGLDINALPAPAATLANAEQTNSWSLTPAISLAQGGLGFVGYCPLKRDGEVRGYLNLVIRIAPMLQQAFDSHMRRQFHTRVHYEGKLIDHSGAGTFDPANIIQTEIEIRGRTWRIEVVPTQAVAAQLQSMSDELVLFGGIMMALVVYFSLNVAAVKHRSLSASEERFDLALKGANDGLWDWSSQTGESYYSPRYYAMLGYTEDEINMNYDTFYSLVHPDDVIKVTGDPIGRIVEAGDTLESEFRMRHKNGHYIDILSRAYLVREGTQVTRIVGTHVDITETKRQKAKLEQAACTDDLTGLRNRRGLGDHLSSISETLAADARLVLLHIDLDKFKSINDTLGHEAGDFVLCAVADTLRAHSADEDVLARIGGDEFLIAKSTVASNDQVTAMCEALIRDVSRPLHFDGKQCNFGASIGIAFHMPGSAEPIDNSIADADIALNTAKSKGRGRCEVFSTALRAQAVRTAVLAGEIRESLLANAFEPYLQPQIDIASGDVIGFEALVRWRHSTRGILNAGAFLDVAEETGLIEDIDTQVYEQAFSMFDPLARAGLPNVQIGINASTAQLSKPHLVDHLIWAADAASIDPHRVSIELLESTILDDRAANVIENIHRLGKVGFAIELDDFGTGHAAIANLQKFNVERIKIDRSLITNIDQDDELKVITSAIVALGRNLGIRVLAEGIETQAELNYMAQIGCTCAQGYLIGHPMSLGDALAWYHERNAAGPSHRVAR